MMTLGSMYSGIGGLELGLERAGLGPVLWQCEIDEWCRRVLARHWPNATRYPDARQLEAPPLVDVICGGFPCQDISDSEGAGLAGPRSGLWYDMLRVVRAVRPRFVVVENVSALTLRGLDAVLGGLATSGYDALWLPVRATCVGLPHGRERVFIVAHTDRDRLVAQPPARLHLRRPPGHDPDRRRARVPGPDDGPAAWGAFRSAGGPEPGVRRGAHGFPTRVDRRRLAALGNAVVPDCAEVAGHLLAHGFERVGA